MALQWNLIFYKEKRIQTTLLAAHLCQFAGAKSGLQDQLCMFPTEMLKLFHYDINFLKS